MNERTEIAPQQTAGSPEGTSCPVCSQLLPRLLRADVPSAPCGRPGKCLRTSRDVPSDEPSLFSPNYLSEWNKMLIFAEAWRKKRRYHPINVG